MKASCLLALRTTRIAGAERIVTQLVKGLEAEFSFEVDVAAVENIGTGYLRTKAQGMGVWAMLAGRYEIIHSHLFLPGVILRIRRLYDKKFRWVHTVHYCAYDGQRAGRLKRLLDRWVFSSADFLVSVSPSVSRSLENRFQYRQIDNALSLEAKGFNRKTVNPKRFTLGAVSMLRPEKGLEELLLALPVLIKKWPGLKLKIAGEGPLEKTLKEMSRRLKLDSHVEFVGYVEEISEFLSTVDIFITPSRTESFGLALLEAMQFNLPIIATAVGETPSLLQNGEFGKLIQRSENQTLFSLEIQSALEDILENPEAWQNRTAAGLAFHSSRLTPHRMVSRYASLYRECLSPGACFVCPIATQATGGLQRQLKLQTREIHKHGYRVFLLQRHDASLDKEKPGWEHVTFISTPNPFPERAKDSSFAHRIRGLSFLLFGFLQIFRHRSRISIIHAHQLYSPSLVGIAAKLFLGKTLVVKVTASGVLGEKRELERLPFFRVRKRLFRSIDKVIVLSEEMRKEALELGFSPEKIALIPNSVEIPSSFRDRFDSLNPDSSFHILYSGRLSTEKNLETLIRASVLLRKKNVEAIVHLVGGTYGGRDASEPLRKLAAQFKDQVDVRFHGSQKVMEPFYLAADAFVLPSQSEGMSNALLEALSYGLPCVASDIEPNRALVEDGKTGLLFRQGDPEDLCEKLYELALDRGKESALNRQLGMNARLKVSQDFSTSSVGEKLDRLYHGLLYSRGVGRAARL